MASAKDKHYWSQLLATLTAGSWDVSTPARAPNGTPLSWNELLRKFNKHCHGYSDVAELASQTQALSLLLIATPKECERPLELGEECVLAKERVEEAATGYAALQSLRSVECEPIKLALAYYAYALGRPSECLSILEGVSSLVDVPTRVSKYEAMNSGAPPSTTPSADTSVTSSRTGSLLSASTASVGGDIDDGHLWAITECIRSVTLQGMAHERISPKDPQKALSAYVTAVPLINATLPEVMRSLPFGSSQTLPAASVSFTKYRELWRWTERVLRRAIILSAQLEGPTVEESQDASQWTLQRIYLACSAHWPPSFRPERRATVGTIHLRAFVLRARLLPPDVLKSKAPRWISSARSVLQELRSLLSVCTYFPRAGERNTRVEDFVDLCVAVWEADGAVGEYATWVIDFLWWATRLTFNSYRIYRHMFRLCAASGDPELAKRTLRLYIQVVSKAREAGSSDGGVPGTEESLDWDSDRQWVQTLVQGAKMLCRLAIQEVDYDKAVEMAKEAGTILEKAKGRLDADDKELVASVQLAEGVWHSVMAYAEQDPRTRTTRIKQSLQCFTAAIGTFPTASAHHHLALALTRPGPAKDTAAAIEHARAAVELDPSEIRHWHLLGLLLAATGDWKAAKSVLELGISMAEADLSEDDTASNPADANGSANDGVAVRDYGDNATTPTQESMPTPTLNGHANTLANGKPKETILPLETKDVPPSSTLLQPPGDRPLSTRQERFEHALQARMTQLALTEFVEGAEAVGDKWLEVFYWFREKRPATLDDRRKSIDSRRVSQDGRLSEVASVRTSTQTQQPMLSTDVTKTGPPPEDSVSNLPTPIPITITPASPGISEENMSRPPMSLSGDVNGEKRSGSLDEKDRDISRGKKVKEVLKSSVHKGHTRITTISKKMAHGVGRHSSLSLKRTSSAPDFHSVLGHNPYQASSIHLRQYYSIHASHQDLGLLNIPPPPRAPSPDPVSRTTANARANKDMRLLSDLWLMSAAIFRRLGKIEQARGAIQEAEVRDEDNPAVWVQLGLYYAALGDDERAAGAFRKALFIHPNDVPATVYLARTLLARTSTGDAGDSTAENVDLAAGLLADLTRGPGWDVPEAWYFLARAYKLQGRRDRERECLNYALGLSETRGVRDVAAAVGWCL